LQYVEDEATVWPGTDQPGLQEGGPLLLQGPQATLVPLKPQRQDMVGEHRWPPQAGGHVQDTMPACPHQCRAWPNTALLSKRKEATSMLPQIADFLDQNTKQNRPNPLTENSFNDS
jgi:hypothetical protein